MNYKKGVDVVNSSGDKIGDLERVVINPRTNEVTHLVVEKGLLFTEDKVIPVEYVASATEDRVTVVDSKLEADDLPDFEEEHYLLADERAGSVAPRVDPLAPVGGYATPYYFYGPAGGWGAVPGLFARDEPRYVVQKDQNIPEDTVALKIGADVLSRDGEKVGSVDEIITDSRLDQATHMVIAEGWLFKSRKVIPTYWIQTTGPDEIHLNVSAAYLEKLPEYEGTSS